jgi:hypothetical protein
MFPVRYGLNSYILNTGNSIYKSCTEAPQNRQTVKYGRGTGVTAEVFCFCSNQLVCPLINSVTSYSRRGLDWLSDLLNTYRK